MALSVTTADEPCPLYAGPGRKGERTDLDLEAYAKAQFPFEYALAEQILKKLEQGAAHDVAKEETGFLAIHIRRVTGGESAT